MAKTIYSPDLCRQLEIKAANPALEIRHRPARYENGTVLSVKVTGLQPAITGTAEVVLEKFLGGGFAGQVYRSRLLSLQLPDGKTIEGLETDRRYAVKIIIPPTPFSRWFRNLIFWMAFQGPFSAQVNDGACRAGLIMQKLLRRAAVTVFGRETAIKDVYASFYDPNLNAYGEITEWIEGRMWMLENDARLELRRNWRNLDLSQTGSPEYIAKRRFMADMVQLMHDMGMPELARQYEWWTMKSQPNVMKRTDLPDANGPADGLCAIDFRAGLALLPWLPMSPGDIKLIIDGIKRKRFIQFDACDFDKLRDFIRRHSDLFAGLESLIEELKTRDREYRRSLPDITRHGFRLFTDADLRRDVRAGLIEGYVAGDQIDKAYAEKLQRGGLRFALFYLLGAIPVLGKMARKYMGNTAYRRHVLNMLTRPVYLHDALNARVSHTLVRWHRSGRCSEAHTRFLMNHPWLALLERFTLGFIPLPGLHRLCVEPSILWKRTTAFFGFLHSFFKNESFREQWFLNELAEGKKAGMLTIEEHDQIVSVIKDPYIVKYLKCLGVHFATLPVTQIIGLLIGSIWATMLLIKGYSWETAGLAFGGTMFALQILPISPGSIVRGLFVVYLMIRERNWRDYLLACPLSFVKYIGYLAFPLQMAASYPYLARFMASRWATNAVHFVPVFGERGALLEHWVFDLFFNVPQFIGRHIRGALSLWCVFGIILASLILWFTPYGIAGWTSTYIALIILFILPRFFFYPILTRSNQKKQRHD